MKPVTVSLYFCPEWWDHHYHCAKPRPAKRDQAALEAMYLGRERFLFEQFGGYGLGREHPQLGSGQIATVIRYGFDLIPALLGTRLEFCEAWGFYPVLRPLAELEGLAAVDIAEHAEHEWIVREKTRLEKRYGGCSHCIDMGSVSNNAFRIIGEEFYAALLTDRAACLRLLEAIITTERYLYRFLRKLFPPMDPVPISNCNASLMGPKLYEEVILAFDGRQNRFAEQETGVAPRAALHHCDVPADDFLAAYAQLPGVASLQASFLTDIRAVKEKIPGCDFSAMVNLPAMLWEPERFRDKIRRALQAGATELAMWNIDPKVAPPRLNDLLGIIAACCAEGGNKAEFSGMPLCWDELEWARADYQQS
ncbi:MAG: hypothetical protein HYV35_00750 [Lentisphaerae bacterium]|nr:hypothetical protein [Lentisphaerota bacterium]